MTLGSLRWLAEKLYLYETILKGVRFMSAEFGGNIRTSMACQNVPVAFSFSTKASQSNNTLFLNLFAMSLVRGLYSVVLKSKVARKTQSVSNPALTNWFPLHINKYVSDLYNMIQLSITMEVNCKSVVIDFWTGLTSLELQSVINT